MGTSAVTPNLGTTAAAPPPQTPAEVTPLGDGQSQQQATSTQRAHPSRRKPTSFVEGLKAAQRTNLTEVTMDAPPATDGQPRNERGQFATATDEAPVDESVQEAAPVEAEGIYTEFPVDDIQRILTEEGLDVNSEADVRKAEAIYKREQRTRQGATEAAAAAQVEELTGPVLTPFERQLLERQQPATAQTQTPPAQQQQFQQQAPPQQQMAEEQAPAFQPTEYPRLNDIGQNWKSMADGINAEMEEYGNIQKMVDAGMTPDYGKLHQIRAAQMNRAVLQQVPVMLQAFQQLIGMAVPQYLQQTIEPLQQKLQPIESAFRNQRLREIGESAIEQMEATPEFKGFREFTKVASDKKLTFKDPESGETAQFPDTLVNRTLIQNPQILRIEIAPDPARGIDEDTAHQLTLIERYRQVHAILSAKRPDPRITQTLIDAGAQQAQRTSLEQTRQRLNAGTPSANGSTQTSTSLVQKLKQNGGVNSGRSLSDLF